MCGRHQESVGLKWHALGRVSTRMWVRGDPDPVKRPIGAPIVASTGLLWHACKVFDVLQHLKVTGMRGNDGSPRAVVERNGVPCVMVVGGGVFGDLGGPTGDLGRVC